MSPVSCQAEEMDYGQQMLVLEVLDGWVGNAEHRVGDWWTLGVVKFFRPYVVVSCGTQTQRTAVDKRPRAKDERPGSVSFRKRMVFPLDDLMVGGVLPPLYIAAYDHRNVQALCNGDPLVGESTCALSRGYLEQAHVELKREGEEKGFGWINLQYGIVYKDSLLRSLSSSAERGLAHALRALANALRLSGENGSLKKARPSLLNKPVPRFSRKRTALEDDQKVADFCTLLFSEAAKLQSDGVDLDDEEVIKQMAACSRRLLVYIADFAVADQTPVDLAIVWVQTFLAECVKSDLGQQATQLHFDEERFRRMLMSAEVTADSLVPVDSKLCEVTLPDKFSWLRATDKRPSSSLRSRNSNAASNAAGRNSNAASPNSSITTNLSNGWGSSSGSWVRGGSGFLAGGVKSRKIAGESGDVLRDVMLGRGSHGCVWRAKDRGTGMVFAVKEMSAKGKVSRREIDMSKLLMSEFKHPCIVSFFGVFETVLSRSLVIEYCPGGDLQNCIKERRDEEETYTPPDRAMVWISQVFLALEHLHLTGPGMLVRDVKPGNVVLTDGGRIAKLTDFGMARKGAKSNGTYSFNSKVPPGSPHYIAPEVITGESYSHSADLYSFGVLVWVVMTGGVLHCKGTNLPPVPPCGELKEGITRLLGNWELLKTCIEDPSNNDANPLPTPTAKDFVLRITDRSQQITSPGLSHQEIRDHEFLRSMDLPERGGEALQDWLDQH